MLENTLPDAMTNEESASAYDSAVVDGSDPRCIPQFLDGPPPVGDEIETPQYSSEDHENWAYLINRQMRILPGRAGEAFLEGVDILGMTDAGIPALKDLSARMEAATGWRVARIPGLLHERDFFELISQRIFPSTDYIRQKHELDYTPAPDCFHDMFGHMPMLTQPDLADYYQLFGKAALRAEGRQRSWLETLHWFTIEFGMIRQSDGLRIFGAGVLSSKDEVVHALSEEVEILPFSADHVIEQAYDVWHLQPVLFALESFSRLVTEFHSWAGKIDLLNG
jgi:phenylalanine-4-hydroxylase